jgi:superkiller protein 3
MGRTRALLSLSQNELKAADGRGSVKSLHKFDKTIKRVSVLLVALVLVFVGYYSLSQYKLSKQSFDSKAVAAAKEAIRKQPRSADARVALGVVYANEENFKDAIEQYKLAIKLVRDHQEAIVYAGLAYLKMEQYDDAMYYFDKEIKYYKNTRYAKSNSMLEQAYYYGAIVLWEKKKNDQALDYVNKSIAIKSTNSDTYLLKGRILLDKKENDNAIAVFGKALEFDPKYIDALYGVAIAYENKGNRAEAIKRYENVLKVDPNYRLANEAITRLKAK